MASRALTPARGVSLDAMLATIPSLPRPVLSRLVARLIDHLDEQDGDPDLEPDDEDRCGAGEDHIIGGAVTQVDMWDRYERKRRIGDDDDAEPNDAFRQGEAE